jgi:hypothetical protein
MPATQIYLDPSAGTPAVIEIDGTCYAMVGTVSVAPDTTSFDSSSSDCTTCTAAPCIDPGGLPTTLTVNFTHNDPTDETPWSGTLTGAWSEWDGWVSPTDDPSYSFQAKLYIYDTGDGCEWVLALLYLEGINWIYVQSRPTGDLPAGAYPSLISGGFDGATFTDVRIS